MLGFCSKRLQLLLPIRSISINSVTHLRFCQNPHSYSSKSLLGSEIDNPKQEDKDSSFKVSYLMNQCGMSQEIALQVSERVHFETREKPDLVLKLFQDYGLHDFQITWLVKKLPRVLACKAKTLLPKLKFFDSIGLSGAKLGHALSRNPTILTRSLEKCIIPCFVLIKSIVVEDKRVGTFFSTSKWSVSAGLLGYVESNVAFLRRLGVRESAISVYLTWHPLTLCRKFESFKKDVDRVLSMGIEPSSSVTFMKALAVNYWVGVSKQEQKKQFYKEWGWTEDEFLLAFRRNPLFMTFGEKNVSSKMDFLLNKMGWKPADVAENPSVLTYSLEKRIIPTCSVIRVLLLKGLITKEEGSLVSILKRGEKHLLNKFVLKYQKQVPELLSIYQGKMALAELGLGFDDRGSVNHL